MAGPIIEPVINFLFIYLFKKKKKNSARTNNRATHFDFRNFLLIQIRHMITRFSVVSAHPVTDENEAFVN